MQLSNRTDYKFEGRNGYEILVVEDTPDVLALLTKILQSAGFRVRQAMDADMALSTLEECIPDLILLDIRLPSIDGFTLCKKIKLNQNTQKIPVIFLTAYDDIRDKIRALELGAADFITKPFSAEELLLRVKTQVDQYQLRRGLEQLVESAVLGLENINRFHERQHSADDLEILPCLTAEMLEANFNGIIVTNADGFILTANSAFLTMTGYTEAEVLGRNPRFLRSNMHDDLFFNDMWESIRKDGFWSGEIHNRCKDGNVKIMRESIHQLKRGDTVVNYIATMADISDKKDAQTIIHFLQFNDGLTGLKNKMSAKNHVEQLLEHEGHNIENVTALFVDIDNFKAINNSFGSSAGDDLLRLTADRLSRFQDKNLHLFRISSDEFLLIAHDLGRAHLEQTSHIILQAIKQECAINESLIQVTASIGITRGSEHIARFEDLLTYSNLAACYAQKTGGNQIRYFEKWMLDEEKKIHDFKESVRNGLAKNEFFLCFQPKFNAVTKKATGAEVLLRWQSANKGFISPAEFIPMAETTGLIAKIDEWVIVNTCKKIADWIEKGYTPPRISINISGQQFVQSDLSNFLATTLANHSLTGKALDIEVTESAFMVNLEKSIEVLNAIKAQGMSISLDDFGTGYSSLSYLKRLPINNLKIDKSFIDNICTNAVDAAIAKTVIDLGRQLKLCVVAEGVETLDQFHYLRSTGCDEIQGYLFERPLSVGDFERIYLQ